MYLPLHIRCLKQFNYDRIVLAHKKMAKLTLGHHAYENYLPGREIAQSYFSFVESFVLKHTFSVSKMINIHYLYLNDNAVFPVCVFIKRRKLLSSEKPISKAI